MANTGKPADINDFRPVPFYFINTTAPEALTAGAITEAMNRLKQDGFGGCIVFNKPPDGFSQEEYLSERWFETIGFFAEAGKQLDLKIWINDGFDFPPGDAGGRIQKINPDLKQRVFARQESGEIVIQEVEWGFPAFEEPESSRLFIELVYEQYRKYLGKYFNHGITGFFSDADCRRFGPVGGKDFANRRYFPASRNFLQQFFAEYHYDLTPFLADIIDGKANQADIDYWSLCEKLYAQWFRNNFNWCRKHNLKYSFHTSDTGPLSREECKRSSFFIEGRYLKLAENCDYPGTDHELLALNGGTHFSSVYFTPETYWGGSDLSVRNRDFFNTYGDTRAKYVASAAWANHQERTLCEAFAATNWGCRHQDLRLISTWQIMQGINFFVPHAIHHRLHGETKYFAPPDFSRYGSLSSGIREFNDWLAEMCMTAAQGELIAQVAVLDPGKAIWQGKTDNRAFFDICDYLNHSPFGYLIVDEDVLLDRLSCFKILVLPDIAISETTANRFIAAGVRLIRAEEIRQLSLLLESAITFKGNGQPQYMHRRLSSGEDICLVANVDNVDKIEGLVNFQGHETELELYPGEIKVIDNRVTSHFHPDTCMTMPLPDIFKVEWEAANILPLTRWQRINGEACHFSQSDAPVIFEWENTGSLHNLELWLPREMRNQDVKIEINGKILTGGSPMQFLADEYLRFLLGHAQGVGIHQIKMTIGKQNSIAWNNIFLAGEFAIDLVAHESCKHFWREYYNMCQFLPGQADIRLNHRPKTLNAGSWTEQGHPFYSGAVKYSCEFTIPESIKDAVLVLPEVESVCQVSLDNEILGKAIWQPYEFKLPVSAGTHQLEITIWNTMANCLEEYRAPSGIIKSPFIKMNLENPESKQN